MKLVTTGETEESKQLAQRQIEGLYTLQEAVNTLCQNVELINKEALLADLVDYVANGKVQVNYPGREEEGKIPKKIRTFYEVAEWSKLNDNWLSTYKHIDWRFPDPLERLRPDWSYWNCDHLSLDNAISLSININPEWKTFNVIGRKNTLRISFDYSPRLTNALNWAQDPNCLWRYDNPSEFKESNQVKLCEFARWVINEKPDWIIPIEFRALVKTKKVLLNENNKSKKGRPKSLKKEDEEKLIQMRINNPIYSHDFLGEHFRISRRTVGNILKKHGIK
jgi:hypothetical protein